MTGLERKVGWEVREGRMEGKGRGEKVAISKISAHEDLDTHSVI
jgi:hypothetical protein